MLTATKFLLPTETKFPTEIFSVFESNRHFWLMGCKHLTVRDTLYQIKDIVILVLYKR